MLALCESNLAAGADFGQPPSLADTVAALRHRPHRGVALCWIYLVRGAAAGRRLISTATDPGQLSIRRAPTSSCRWWPASSPPEEGAFVEEAGAATTA
jgi:hypothetical protein